ncbi:MAG: hypothetical protein JST64_00890 [Actinobacteria bacterium]|nr:hypothetical protein [Actinomycetota bacterium]
MTGAAVEARLDVIERILGRVTAEHAELADELESARVEMMALGGSDQSIDVMGLAASILRRGRLEAVTS